LEAVSPKKISEIRLSLHETEELRAGLYEESDFEGLTLVNRDLHIVLCETTDNIDASVLWIGVGSIESLRYNAEGYQRHSVRLAVFNGYNRM
jgi:hypothetical protein